MRFNAVFSICLLLWLTACSGESDGNSDGDSDDDIDGVEMETDAEVVEDTEGDSPAESDAEIYETVEESDSEAEAAEENHSPDYARVFMVNPVTTPEPTGVELQGVADDLNGSLTSTAAPDGCRLLRVVTCVDDGASNTINTGSGPVTQNICTLRPLADKYSNGNFDYNDWSAAVEGSYNDSDVHAEVELYYHAQKMYAFLTQPAVGLWQRLPGRHENGDSFVPLTLVANYRLPSQEDALAPISMSMFIPEEYRAMGMGDIYGLTGYVGDALVFGQGERADFAYDGETVYHEFGHWVNYALAGLTNETAIDKYGLSNLGSALEQGLAETLVFLVSGRTHFFEYIDDLAGPGFARDADNDFIFPDSLTGFDQSDGMIAAGTSYEIFTVLEEDYDFDAARFARVILKTISSLNENGAHTFANFAGTLLAEIESEGGSMAAAASDAVITARGLKDEVRAKDISEYHSGGGEILYFGGAINMPWNTYINLMEDTSSIRTSTATVQTCLTNPESDANGGFSLSGIISALPDSFGMYPESDDWNLAFLLRKDQPVEYAAAEGGSWTAAYDARVSPQMESITTPGGQMQMATWTLSGLEPGAYYCLHLINQGDSPGVLMDIAVNWE